MRHAMRLGRAWGPLLRVFGGTPGRSFVDVADGAVRFRFGWGFDVTMPRTEIERATPASWPVIGGIGWRLGPGGVVGLIGSLRGVVEVALRAPRRVRLVGIPWRCRRLYVSLEDPEAFLADLGPPE